MKGTTDNKHNVIITREWKQRRFQPALNISKSPFPIIVFNGLALYIAMIVNYMLLVNL
jgi:hypothetical protein